MRYYDRHEDASTINRFIEDLREKCWKPHWEQYCRWGRGLYSVFIPACLQTGYIYIYVWLLLSHCWTDNPRDRQWGCYIFELLKHLKLVFIQLPTLSNLRQPSPKDLSFFARRQRNKVCAILLLTDGQDADWIMVPLIFRVPKALMVGPCIEYPDVFPRIAWCI